MRLTALMLLVGLLLCLLLRPWAREPQPVAVAGAYLPASLWDSLQAGDLILRRGHGFISDQVVRLLQEPMPLSHCGLLVYEEGQWQVWHALSREVSLQDGLQAEPLTDFLAASQPGHLLLLRSAAGADLVAAARPLLARAIPFDHHFDLLDTQAYYCTEFIQQLRLRAGLPPLVERLFPNGQPYVGLGACYAPEAGRIYYRGEAL